MVKLEMVYAQSKLSAVGELSLVSVFRLIYNMCLSLPLSLCSFYGYCGTSAVHCDNKAIAPQPSPSTGGEAPSIFGSCGGGEIGNGICADNNECCSTYGL